MTTMKSLLILMRLFAKVKEFYSNLYKRRSSKSESDCLNYLKNISIPKLSTKDTNKCEGRLSKQECWDALQSFGNNKIPGNDGLSKEFYICFSTRSMPIL